MVDESGARVGEVSLTGEARWLAPGLTEEVSAAVLPIRLASWRDRFLITSDFIEIGRADPWSL
jgi:hypothetical protein